MNVLQLFVKRLFIALTIGCFFVLGGAGNLYGAATDWSEQSHSQARLIIDHDVLGPEQSVKLGLQIRLQPGWHSYWVNPGAAGDAPHIEVSVSGRQLVKQGSIQWPVPLLLKEGDLSAYAYKGTFLLPQSLELAGKGSAIFNVRAQWLVCADVCVPEQKEFTLSLPSDTQSVINPEAALLFAQADRDLPQSQSFEGKITPENNLVIKNDIFSKESVQTAYFFPFKTGLIDPNAEQKLYVEKGLITLSLKADSSLEKRLSSKKLEGLLALTDHHGQTVYVTLKTKGETPSFVPASPVLGHHETLGLILVFAFLGGVILNGMPCVFPVLAMKCLSLIALNGAERRKRRESAFYYTAGVVGSFVVLGAVLLTLRWLGRAVGWGFQFHSPYFIAAMSWVLLLLALNVSDVFYIGLGKAGNGLASGVMIPQKQGGTRLHDVITGFVAVLLATPCVAPFMGVAVAAALSHSALIGIASFIFMGLGLAFPYSLLANVPALVRLLPRSGRWMDVFKKFLAFPLLASCVWLLWVGVLQNGAGFIIPVAGGGVLLSLAAWLYGLSQKNRIIGVYKRLNTLNYMIIILCIIITFTLLFTQLSSISGVRGHASGQTDAVLPEGWDVFSQEKLQKLQKEGKPVFVDMTASWCITCLVNERVALKTPSVLTAFKQHHVTVLVGDWTKGDEEISRYLRHYGRDGVPLYVYYPPSSVTQKQSSAGYGNGIKLPQLLSPSLVISTLNQ